MLLILLVIVADILLGVTEDLVVIPVVCSLVFDLVLGGLYVEVSVRFEVSGKLV